MPKRSARMRSALLPALLLVALSLLLLLLLSPPGVTTQPDAATQQQQQVAAVAALNQSLFWGTYRPNLYFGTRTRASPSLLTGLLWYGPGGAAGGGWKDMRHTCEQTKEVSGYAWNQHDGRTFGIQTLTDHPNNLRLTTSFLKSPDGEDWVVRVQGEALDAGRPCSVSLLYYAALEVGSLEARPRKGGRNLTLAGQAKALGGKFVMSFVKDPTTKWATRAQLAQGEDALQRPRHTSLRLPRNQLWRVKEAVKERIAAALAQEQSTAVVPEGTKSRLVALPEEQLSSTPNLVVTQHLFTGPFSLDIVYLSRVEQDGSQDQARLEHLSGPSLTERLAEASARFQDRFEATFRLSSKGFSSSAIAFGQLLLSNMVGGLAYFQGTSIVDRSREDETDVVFDHITEPRARGSGDDDGEFEDEDEEGNEIEAWATEAPRAIPRPRPKEEGPSALFTAVPSRPFFPRGFLWDEGFHQLLIGRWDPELSLDIITHWVGLMDHKGWIAREQILGEEARSKVPARFQIQYPHYANPPTLVYALERLLHPTAAHQLPESVSGAPLDSHLASVPLGAAPTPSLDSIRSLFHELRRHYDWFLDTQWGEINEWERPEHLRGFRWRGRLDGHTFTSGLDDYPRGPYPHSGELHVDLMSWMAFFAKTLLALAEQLGDAEAVEVYRGEVEETLTSLHALHWDEEERVFSDVMIDDETKDSYFVVHKGYVSLFPMFLGLLDEESDAYGAGLDLIESRDDLWTDYGLASLSRADEHFGLQDNYWRGPIWININYLVLARLHAYNGTRFRERVRTVYTSLRENVMGNVMRQYEATGYPWEQYSPLDGAGRGSHPFTGWTALTLLIMAEMY